MRSRRVQNDDEEISLYETNTHGNYYGITVTPMILEALEHVLKDRHSVMIYEYQSKLQSGFTKGKFPLTSAVLLTKCHQEV